MALTDREVIATLEQELAPEALSQSLNRILRIPSAWDFLHDADQLSKLDWSAASKGVVGPIEIAAFSLTGTCESKLPNSLSHSDEVRLDQIWKAGPIRSDYSFRDIALLAVKALRHSHSSQDQPPYAELSTKSAWNSALALAWTEMPAPGEVINNLIAADANAIAVQLLLSTMDADESAKILVTSCPDRCLGLLKYLVHTPEKQLQRALANAISNSPVEVTGSQAIPALITKSLAGEVADGAHMLLEQAWDRASAQAAEIADLMSHLAGRGEDPVMELEAALQANHKAPSPKRRAQLALALTNQSKNQEALEELETSSTDAIWEQSVAAARAHLGLDQLAQSEVFLEKAAEQFRIFPSYEQDWISKFVETALMAGRTDIALQAAEAGIEGFPADSGMRLAYAKLLLEAGDPYEASQELALATSLDPSNTEALRLLALSAGKSGDHDSAIRHWEKLAGLGSDCEEELVEAALNAGKPDRAQKVLPKMLNRNPESIHYRILSAKAQFIQGDKESALQILEEQQHTSVEASIAKAQLLLEDGAGEQALTVLRDACQAFPESDVPERAIGRIAASLGKHSEAVQHFAAARKSNPNDGELLVELADAFSKLGRSDEALEALQAALKRIPRSWSALSKLAILQSNEGNWEAAGLALPLPPTSIDLEQASTLAQLAAEAALRSGNADIANKGLAILATAEDRGLSGHKLDLWSAMLHEAAGDFTESLQLYQSAIKGLQDNDDEELQESLIGLARSALASEQSALAISTLERAKELYPRSLPVWHLLATSYLAANLTDRAIDCAQAAIQLDRTGIEAKRLLGLALTAAGKHEEAIVAFEQVAQVTPSDPAGWLDLAESAHRASNAHSLRPALAKALYLGRQDVGVLTRAFDLQMSMQNPLGGIIALQAAVKHDPGNSELLTRLATVSMAEGQIDRAFAVWMQLANQDTTNIDAKHAAADAAIELDKASEAIALWEQILSVTPHDVEARKALANAYCDIGEISKGMAEYEQASSYAPEDHLLAVEAGRAALNAGSMTDALAHLARACDLNPADINARLAFAECLAELERWSELKDTLVDLALDDGHARTLLAISFYGLGEFSDADQAYESAVQSEVKSPQEAIWRARLAWKLGRFSEVIGPLEQFKDTSTANREWLSMTILLHHVRWLLQRADVQSNLPIVNLDPEQIMQAVDRLPMVDREVAFLERRVDIALSEVSPGELEDLLVIAKDDDSESAAEEFAAAYLSSGRAKEGLLMVSANDPKSDLGAVISGLCNETLGRHQFALDDYGEAMIAPALHPVVHYLLARTHLAMNDATQAAYHLQTAVSEWPKEPEWQYQLAQIYLGTGALEGAIGHLQFAIESSPDNAAYNLSLARAYRQAKQQSRAESSYHRALKGFPDDGELHKEAAELSLELGNHSAAAMWFDRASTLLPSDSACLMGGARALIAMGRNKEAADWIDSAKRIAPEDPDVMLGAAEITASQGNFAKALEIVGQLNSNGNNQKSIQRVKHHILIRSGRIDEALEGLRSTVAEDPSDHHAWHSLALAHERRGAIDDAVEASKAAVKLSPDNPEYCLTQGRLCRSAGQLDQALEFLSRAKRSAVDDWRIEYQLGKVYEDRRDLDLALRAYERTREIDPTNAKAYYRSGLILRSMKSYDQAGQMLRKSVELDPDDREALHQLAAVRALELVHGNMSVARSNL
jgi:tetratricopeptide (TPR) repeat protein